MKVPVMGILVKTCSICKTEKLLSGFHKHKRRKGGVQDTCKICSAAHEKKWYAENRERIRAKKGTPEAKRKYRDWAYKRRYGISLADYERMVTEQQGCCALCDRKKKLVVDHDHKTKRIRGLLCHTCNTNLGAWGDNLGSVIKKLTNYLKE